MNYWESGNKQIKIEYSNGTITNSDIPNQALKLKESICSNNILTFGLCEASKLIFKCYETRGKLMGETLTVKIEKNGETEQIGIYKVVSEKPNADRTYREIVAYDKLYDILNADVSEWYNGLTFPISMENFRHSLAAHFNLTETEANLPNDSMIIEKTIEASELSGKTVLNAICELNACFGHITKDGELEYIVLEPIGAGKYPSETLYPSENLFPSDENNVLIPSRWRYETTYEDYITRKITAIHIRSDINDAGCIVGEESNPYIITGNFLVLGKNDSQLQNIARNILEKVKDIAYRPAKIRCVANLDIKVGESVVCFAKNEVVRTYVFERTVEGVSGLTDTYTSKGKEEQSEQRLGVQGQMLELRRLTNTLTRTVEKTVSELKDADQRLSTRITQTASRIESVASTADGAYSIASQTASEISNYVKLGEDYAGMKITASGIEIKTNGTFTVESGKFGINANGEMFCTGGSFGAWKTLGGALLGYSGKYLSSIEPAQIIIASYEDGASEISPSQITTPLLKVSSLAGTTNISPTKVSTHEISTSFFNEYEVSWQMKKSVGDNEYILCGYKE